MKTIFLDIDGVLNSEDWFRKTKECNKYTEINPEKVKLLKEIVNRTSAEIILSSTWRTLVDIPGQRDQHPQYDYLLDSLEKFGLKIKGHTPYLKHNRPKEIIAWLDEHGEKGKNSFVSLDDDFFTFQYAQYGISDHLVKTCFFEPNGGIRREHVEKAVKILNGE